jgi:hypothetical protein
VCRYKESNWGANERRFRKSSTNPGALQTFGDAGGRDDRPKVQLHREPLSKEGRSEQLAGARLNSVRHKRHRGLPRTPDALWANASSRTPLSRFLVPSWSSVQRSTFTGRGVSRTGVCFAVSMKAVMARPPASPPAVPAVTSLKRFIEVFFFYSPVEPFRGSENLGC